MMTSQLEGGLVLCVNMFLNEWGKEELEWVQDTHTAIFFEK